MASIKYVTAALGSATVTISHIQGEEYLSAALQENSNSPLIKYNNRFSTFRKVGVHALGVLLKRNKPKRRWRWGL